MSNAITRKPFLNRQEWSWVLYDWANSAFVTTVAVFFFPIFFKDYYNGSGVDVSLSSYRLGLVNSLASLFIFLAAPTLGSIADRGGFRKQILSVFAVIGALSTIALFFVGPGQWYLAALIFFLASLGFAGGNVFYDAMLTSVTSPHRYEKLSTWGFAIGYLGGGLLLTVNVLMVLQPELFGIQSKALATKLSFVTVGVWWLLFSIPLFLNIHDEPKNRKISITQATREGLTQLLTTFKEITRYRHVLIFLLAYCFYIDAINTLQKMAADYGRAIGVGMEDIIKAGIMIQFVGFPATLGFLKIAQKYNAKVGIMICITAFVVVTIWGYSMQSSTEFYGLALIIGLFQGGIQSLSRSTFAHIIPRDKSGEFFGFYNIMGKAAAIFGPFLMGQVSLMFGNPRMSIWVLTVFLLLGAYFLSKVRIPKNS